MRKLHHRYQITNVKLYGGPLVTISVRDDRIVHVGDHLDGPNTIDGQGLIALPGLVDPHVHFRHLGEDNKEDWEHAVDASILGGVTTVGDMGNHPGPFAVTTAEAFAYKLRRLEQQRIRFQLWFMALPHNLDQLPLILHDKTLRPHLAGIKVAMEETTGGLILAQRKDQLAWAHVAADHDVLIAAHVGIQSLIDENRQRFVRPTMADHCVIRESKGEIDGGMQWLDILERTGARGHIAHISTPELAAAKQEYCQRGVRVTAEMCPHHYFFDDKLMRSERAPLFKMNPPLRTPEQVVRLRECLLDGDTIDIIATDHAPHTSEEKHGEDYDKVPSGLPGVQERLPLTWELVHQGRLSV